MRDTKSCCMKPMLCIVTMTIRVVILELTDQRNRRKFCYQYESQQKGIVHSDDDGDGLCLQKNGRCFNIRRMGTGIYLRPRPMLAGVCGNGLYLRKCSSIYDGEGLLLGPSTPFREIPILGWILCIIHVNRTK